MLSSKLRRLFNKITGENDISLNPKKKKFLASKKKNQSLELPENVWNKIFDYSSPFDVTSWRRVSKKVKTIVDDRDQSILYLDVLRIDINELLPRGKLSDGDFFRHSTTQIVAHMERRSMLLAAHSHWTPREATKLFQAIQYYGKFAHTITLDASIAELCVAAQSSNDIVSWFSFQTMAGSSDICSEANSPSWMPAVAQNPCKAVSSLQKETTAQWKPKSHRIPLGPLFPRAKEISFRCSVPQLRRIRRLTVYSTPSSLLFNPNTLQMFRLSISGGRRMSPGPLRLSAFHQWIGNQRKEGKVCIQFC